MVGDPLEQCCIAEVERAGQCAEFDGSIEDLTQFKRDKISVIIQRFGSYRKLIFADSDDIL